MNSKAIAGGAVILLGVGGFVAYDQYQRHQAEKRVAAEVAEQAKDEAAKAEMKKGKDPDKQVEVPDLRGASSGEAEGLLKKAGFIAPVVEERPPNYGCAYDNEKDILPVDSICEQDPGKGAMRAVNGLKIKITVEHDTFEHGGVESGHEWRRMPNLEGMPLAEALALLADKGFGETEFEIKSGSCDKEIVCDTIPDGGQRKRSDTPGTLRVGGH
jgi:hypothetical protein